MTATRRTLIAATLLAPAMLAPAGARAQAWAPPRRIGWVAPFPAGGATDVVARVLAERMQEAFGQPAVCADGINGVRQDQTRQPPSRPGPPRHGLWAQSLPDIRSRAAISLG